VLSRNTHANNRDHLVCTYFHTEQDSGGGVGRVNGCLLHLGHHCEQQPLQHDGHSRARGGVLRERMAHHHAGRFVGVVQNPSKGCEQIVVHVAFNCSKAAGDLGEIVVRALAVVQQL
jgi:hypothetical protein